MIVVDSNVIVYSVLNSDQTADAEAVLRKDAAWVAPALWLSEVRNVLMLYVRRGTLSVVNALEIVEAAIEKVQTSDDSLTSERILQLADSSGCTAYDCEFVVTAESLNVPLITADKKVLAAFPNIAISMSDFVSNRSNV